MSSPSSIFIQEKFAEYYQKNSSTIRSPSSTEKREFGFLLLKERIMLRHKAFRNVDGLTSFLEKVGPSDVFYSSAYYEDPEREMEKKGWLGADLIFDIDADHIPTPCTKTHDRWICANCRIIGRGLTPQNCPGCGERKFDERTWPCEKCLESAKKETIKLMDILIRDFAFFPEEIRVSFSGHRGYHVQVEREEIRTLNQMARKEIVDYIVGIGLDTRFHGLRDAPVLTGPILDDPGWSGRIARGTYDFLLKATPEELKKAGLKKKRVDTIIKYKEKLLESRKEGGRWGIVKDLGVDSWRRIAERGAKIQSARIDTVVTTDIHRLIRLGNSLHGKTAMIKIEVPANEIEDFDPFTDAVVFKEGKEEVIVSDAPRFRLGDAFYGPYKGEKAELPTAVALLLLCKKAAKVVR